MSFAYLHAHSDYTLSDGSMRIEEYLDRLEAIGVESAALTDTHNLFGAVTFHQKAFQRGIKPIVGVDLRVADAGGGSMGARSSTRRLRVLVRNRDGYRRLSRLLSDSYRRRRERGLYVPLDELAEQPEGLIVMGPPGPGPESSIGGWDEEDARSALEASLDRFGDHFYTEVPLYPSQLSAFEPLVTVARELDITVVPTRPAYMPNSGDEERLRLRRAIQSNHTLEESPPLPSHRPGQYVAAPEDLEPLADRLDLSLDAAGELAEECYFEFETGETRIPRYPHVEGDSNEGLTQLVRSKLDQRSYAADMSTVEDRLSRELDVIQSMGFSDYFLIVADVVNWARDQGIRVGPGRGSAAGSLVAYVLGITTVDPFQYDLIFERFLNPQRNEMPDIDIDFADDRREEVIQYIRERFGEQAVAHIITFGRMRARNSLRDVGRIRGEPQRRIDDLAEAVPGGTDESLQQVLNHVDGFREKVESDEAVGEWVRQAQQIEGMVRNASVHAAGLLVGDGRLDEDIPLYVPDESDPVPASQYDMYNVESLGFLKLDILGLKTLTVIERTLDWIPESERPPVDDLPDGDEDTFQFILEGSLEGIFQFESAGSRELVRDMKPRTRQDLVDCIALYRPGPMEVRDEYLRRRQDPDRVEYPHGDLEPVLEDTYGLVIYQEQVMAIARRVGGFSWSEADTLRKAMGKKRTDLMDTMRDQFVEGATADGYDRDWAEELFEKLAQFAEYGFNRSHSAAYGEITYITAYLKAHHTPAFYTGLLSVRGDNHDRLERIVRGMREDGVPLKPPSINESRADFHREGDAVRYGLRAIKHVGGSLAREIEEVRREQRFEGVRDFVERVDPDVLQSRNFKALAAAGCFDEFDVDRGALSDRAEQLLARGKKRYRERDAGQSNMFEGGSADRDEKLVSDNQQWSRQQRRRARKKALGYVPGRGSSREGEGMSLLEFTYPGSVERFGELASTDGDVTGPNPQLVARVDSKIDDGTETLLKLTDGQETIMVRARSDFEPPANSDTPLLFELVRDAGDWVIHEATPVPSGDDLGIEIHLGSHQNLNQLRQLKQVLHRASGTTPVHLVVDNDHRLDVSISVEPSPNLRDRVERIVGSNQMRLVVL